MSLPWIVYNEEQANQFLTYQHTIDTLISMPHTIESRDEMLVECRRIHNDNQQALTEINDFEQNYNSTIAIQWYSRESFLYRIYIYLQYFTL